MARQSTAPLFFYQDETGAFRFPRELVDLGHDLFPKAKSAAKKILGEDECTAEVIESVLESTKHAMENPANTPTRNPRSYVWAGIIRALLDRARREGVIYDTDTSGAMSQTASLTECQDAEYKTGKVAALEDVSPYDMIVDSKATEFRANVEKKILLDKIKTKMDGEAQYIFLMRMQQRSWTEIAEALKVTKGMAQYKYKTEMRKAAVTVVGRKNLSPQFFELFGNEYLNGLNEE
jgi:DNA-directed RNA polymerase specialized sigma24 family protein